MSIIGKKYKAKINMTVAGFGSEDVDDTGVFIGEGNRIWVERKLTNLKFKDIYECYGIDFFYNEETLLLTKEQIENNFIEVKNEQLYRMKFNQILSYIKNDNDDTLDGTLYFILKGSKYKINLDLSKFYNVNSNPPSKFIVLENKKHESEHLLITQEQFEACFEEVDNE